MKKDDFTCFYKKSPIDGRFIRRYGSKYCTYLVNNPSEKNSWGFRLQVSRGHFLLSNLDLVAGLLIQYCWKTQKRRFDEILRTSGGFLELMQSSLDWCFSIDLVLETDPLADAIALGHASPECRNVIVMRMIKLLVPWRKHFRINSCVH